MIADWTQRKNAAAEAQRRRFQFGIMSKDLGVTLRVFVDFSVVLWAVIVGRMRGAEIVKQFRDLEFGLQALLLRPIPGSDLASSLKLGLFGGTCKRSGAENGDFYFGRAERTA